MATETKIVTLYQGIDRDSQQAISPRTKTSAVSDENNVSLDVLLEDLKKSVSDGKSSVAGAITAKGVPTASDATFATMAANIEAIETGTSGNDEPTTTIGIYTTDVTGTGAAIRVWVEEDGVRVSETDYHVNKLNPTPVTIADTITIDYGVTLAGNYTVKALKSVQYNGNDYAVGSVVAQWPYTFNASVTIKSGGNNGIDTSDATATAADILAGETAYVNGEKVTGTMTDRTVVDSSIGGVSSSYPDWALHQGTNLTTTTPTSGGESWLIMRAPEGYYDGKVCVGTPRSNLTKSIQSGNLYLEGIVNYSAGYLSVGLQTPIRPTLIGYNITQNNADSGGWTWYCKIEGKRNGTDTWDVLVPYTAYIAGGGSKTLSGSTAVTASYYYSQFRVYAQDRGRISPGAYIQVTGDISW